MSYFLAKTLLAVLFIAAGLAAALSMLTLMGKPEKKSGTEALKRTHRVAGWLFTALLAVMAIMGLNHLAATGDTLPLRGVLHWTLASLLAFVLLLKLVVVRFFKQFLKFAPVMGMLVTVLALLVVMVSAVFYVITGGNRIGSPPTDTRQAESSTAGGPADDRADEVALGDASVGQEVFLINCAGCHNHDSADPRIGPGLAGLFDRERLTLGDRPVTRATVRSQIVDPLGTMPSFDGFLSDSELDDLVAYLETL